jgi:hypothetical protein
MPRYFFNVTDGHSTPDLIGTKLPDTYAAQAEAIRASADMLREMGAGVANQHEPQPPLGSAPQSVSPAWAKTPSHNHLLTLLAYSDCGCHAYRLGARSWSECAGLRRKAS